MAFYYESKHDLASSTGHLHDSFENLLIHHCDDGPGLYSSSPSFILYMSSSCEWIDWKNVFELLCFHFFHPSFVCFIFALPKDGVCKRKVCFRCMHKIYIPYNMHKLENSSQWLRELLLWAERQHGLASHATFLLCQHTERYSRWWWQGGKRGETEMWTWNDGIL